ncbi:MAG TPA: glycosyltransferase family 2 protein [Rhizomicrobium sp.]|jgi:glycosyltransferase involved in cell wall biosynthesis
MRFSVVIPVYNRAEPLRRAIASVLAQSCQEFEIVVVDDGSNDDPRAAAECFADPRIRFFRQENGGGGAARNTGIDQAQGDWIAFLDSDDVFLPGHLEQMSALLDGTANTAGYAPMIVERGAGRRTVKPPRALRHGEDMATYLLCDRGFVPTITLVLPREIARNVRYDDTLPFAQDTDFAIRLFQSGCRFVMAKEPGAVWKDLPDPNRVSAGRKGARLIPWLAKMRLPSKARIGAQGWLIAKGLAPSHPLKALGLYLKAVLRGCYSPKLALVIGLQIFFPDALYRRLADGVIGRS